MVIFGLPAILVIRSEKLPFDAEQVEDLRDLNPDYVFIGNSLLESRINPDYLSELTGGKTVSRLASVGSSD